MHDVTLTRRSALALALSALAVPSIARLSVSAAPPPSATKLAEQPVQLTERGVIWQASRLSTIIATNPAWPFHAGFLVALDEPLTVLDQSGTQIAALTSNTALAVAENTSLIPTAATAATPYLAVELVGQDDSDSPFRRPFKADPGSYTLTLWSLTADAGSDADITTLLGENLSGAPVMIYVVSGGVSVTSASAQAPGQILQGNWDAVDTGSSITVPGGVTAQLLIATISSTGSGGDDDLGTGSASAKTTGNPSSIVSTSYPGVFLVNYRTTSLDPDTLTWQIVTGVANQQPEETRYHRGFIAALNGAIALTEEDGTFRRVGGGNAITVRNGDRFSARSLTPAQEPFIAVELLSADEANDASAPTFDIPDGTYRFELWRAAIQAANLDASGTFMSDATLPQLIYIQRGEATVSQSGAADLKLSAGLSQIVTSGASFALTGTSAAMIIGRLVSTGS